VCAVNTNCAQVSPVVAAANTSTLRASPADDHGHLVLDGDGGGKGQRAIGHSAHMREAAGAGVSKQCRQLAVLGGNMCTARTASWPPARPRRR
jgi:hypothetical protein